MRIFLICCFSLLLVACGDDRPERLQANIKTADYLIQNLGGNLDSNRIRNAIVLKQYAQLLTEEKPQLKPLLVELSKDASRNGPMFLSLSDRLSTLKKQPNVLGDIEAQLFESEILIEAADPTLFSDALSDPINVIADMSDGKYARVNAISQEQSLKANAAENNGAGSQLVGNPGYGQWQNNSNGLSFWHWYGAYAMFSAISRPIGYHNWSSGRDYSYYNDVGRNRYTSPQQKKTQDNLATRTKKQFGNRGGFKSPYAKPKTGSSSLSTASKKAQRASSFSSRSSYSKQKSSSSSFRNSTSTTSRGISRGK